MRAQRLMIRGAGPRTVVLLSALVSAAFLAALLSATGGRFVPAVADLYVVCQYAKAMGEGHPFQYNPGEAPSTGATSLLHTLLLAGAWKAGFRGDALVAFAVLTGAFMAAATAALAYRVALRLAGDREARLAGALVALGGPVAWGFHYGSDIALFMLLATWLFERLLASWERPAAVSALLPASLLAVARPEGLPIGLVIGGAWLFRGGGLRSLLPASIGVLVLGLNRVLTGAWLASSALDKSLFAAYGIPDGLALLSEYGVDVLRGLLLGFYPSQSPVGLSRGWASLAFPPLGLVFVLVTLARLPRPGLRVWAAVVGLVWILGAPNVFLGVHFNRYLLWAFPSLLVLVAVGLGLALEARLFRAAAAVFLVLATLSTLRFALLYGEAAGEIARRDLSAARFISASLPAGATIANVATSVEYLTGHRNVNLHGVTSPAFFGGNVPEREASMLEALARLPRPERPSYLLSSSATQATSPILREIAAAPPLFESFSCSEELQLFRTRYDVLEQVEAPVLQDTLEAIGSRRRIDELNVGDGPDERAHAYEVRTDLEGLRLWGLPRVADYATQPPVRLADAGRAILGEESFEFQGLSAGQDALLVMRTAPEASARVLRASGARTLSLGLAEARVELRAGSRTIGESRFRPRSGWDEVSFLIPGASVGDRLRLTLSGRYASFRYWVYQ